MKKKKVVIGIVFFSFVLSSCKMCEDKNKTNPVERVDENILKSKVGRYLQAKGADDAEIRQMLKIEKEDFGENIGHIVGENGHYYYEGHDNGWTHSNCGLYAVKRLLFVLGKHNIVDKDLWYRYTDSQLREMLLETPGHGKQTNQNITIPVPILRTLMEDLGVPDSHRRIYGRTGLEVDGNTVSESVHFAIGRHETARQDLEAYNNPDTRLQFYPGEDVEKRTKELEQRVREKKEDIDFWEKIMREHEKKIKRLLGLGSK